jgi:hypothetical protein
VQPVSAIKAGAPAAPSFSTVSGIIDTPLGASASPALVPPTPLPTALLAYSNLPDAPSSLPPVTQKLADSFFLPAERGESGGGEGADISVASDAVFEQANAADAWLFDDMELVPLPALGADHLANEESSTSLHLKCES